MYNANDCAKCFYTKIIFSSFENIGERVRLGRGYDAAVCGFMLFSLVSYLDVRACASIVF